MKPWRWGALTAAKQRCEFGLTAQNAASSDRHSHLINAHTVSYTHLTLPTSDLV